MPGATFSVTYSGQNDVDEALRLSGDAPSVGEELPFLALGGDDMYGAFTPQVLNKAATYMHRVKEAGYRGVMFYVAQVSRVGGKLLPGFDTAFATARDIGLMVGVTIPHTAPVDAEDPAIGVRLVRHFVASRDIDMLSPQLYHTGGEREPDFKLTSQCNEAASDDPCSWDLYRATRAMFVPSIVDASHFEHVTNFFEITSRPVRGFIQWRQFHEGDTPFKDAPTPAPSAAPNADDDGADGESLDAVSAQRSKRVGDAEQGSAGVPTAGVLLAILLPLVVLGLCRVYCRTAALHRKSGLTWGASLRHALMEITMRHKAFDERAGRARVGNEDPEEEEEEEEDDDDDDDPEAAIDKQRRVAVGKKKIFSRLTAVQLSAGQGKFGEALPMEAMADSGLGTVETGGVKLEPKPKPATVTVRQSQVLEMSQALARARAARGERSQTASSVGARSQASRVGVDCNADGMPSGWNANAAPTPLADAPPMGEFMVAAPLEAKVEPPDKDLQDLGF